MTRFFDPAIYYLLPIEGDDDRLTPFQGFSRGVCDAAPLLRYLQDAPASALDLLYENRIDRIRAIASGLSRYRIVPLNVAHLSALKVTVATPFWVALSWAFSDETISRWIASCDIPPLHATNSPGVGDITLDNICESTIRKFVAERARYLRSLPEYAHVAGLLLDEIREEPARTRAPFPRTDHNVLLPNEHTMVRGGFVFSDTEHFNPGLGDQPVVDAVATSFAQLRLMRAESGGMGEPAFTITVPGHSRAMAQRLHEATAAARKSDKRDAAKRLSETWRWLSRGGGYFPTTQDVEFAQHPAVHAVMQIRALEMRAFSGALAIRAASEFAPVIRLPPRFADAEPTLQQLTQCYGGNSARRSEKLSKLKTRLVRQLAAACPKELLALIGAESSCVRIVSDLPLEWIPMSDGRPLMFKHQTSRIPCSPGNLMFQTLLPQPLLRLRASDLKKLLVIRALRTDDQLYSSLQIAIDGFCKETPDLDVTFVDVATVDDLRSALDDFDGAWVIFDGHGRRDSSGSSLVVGSQQFDPWTLRGKTRVPPIVIPLACDMHPLVHNHSSAASGFLAAGARTCFGSLLPINGYTSARFVGRLVRAVNEMLSVLFVNGTRETTWANLFRIVHHSQFAHELLTCLSEGPDDPRQDGFLDVVSKTTLRSMGGDPTWYDECLAGFASVMGMTRTEFEVLLQSRIPLMDCMLYVQLGDPESIIVCKDDDELIEAD